jgi:hypothetical protein
MSKIFKPRRGKASTMNGTKSSTVLAAGEMFIELPDTGVGTGICKMKMGDGVTAYGSLPYAMGGDIATTEITGAINDDTSSTATAALANVTTGKTLGSIIGSLRRACSLNAQAIATLNDEMPSCLKFQTVQLSPYETKNINMRPDTVCIINNSTNASRLLCFVFSATTSIPAVRDLITPLAGYQHETSGLYFILKNLTQYTLRPRLIYLY